MTPQLASLRILEHDPLESAAAGDDGAAVARFSALVPFPGRGAAWPQGAMRALPWVLEREARHRRVLGVADLAACALAVLLALSASRQAVLALAALPLITLLFKMAGLYDRDQLRLVHSTLDELPALLQITGLFTLGVTMLEPLVVGDALRAQQIAAVWLSVFVIIAAGRVVARFFGARVAGAERCLVIGDAVLAERVRDKIATSSARATVVATLPMTDAESLASEPADVRWLADRLRLDRIIIAPATPDAESVAELIRVAKAVGVRVSVLPRMLEVVGSSVEFDDVDGLTMLAIRPFGLPRSSHALKRTFDLLITALGALAISPIAIAIALAIKLDTRGPVFFRQVRVGRDGRRFRIFKFRSMVVDAEQQKDRLRALNEVGEGDGGMFKVTNDPRVTRVGNLLRKTSLDELPQLLNVLRGEMSLVGPRPLVIEEDEQVLGLDRSRLHLTPGMTGPWQVLGARVPMREMVGLDYLYVANWSLWQDVKILLYTLRHVARGGNV